MGSRALRHVRICPARPVHGTAAGWSATLDPAKGWESRVDGSGLIGPTVGGRLFGRVQS
jgi:hypothetical protein